MYLDGYVTSKKKGSRRRKRKKTKERENNGDKKVVEEWEIWDEENEVITNKILTGCDT